MLKKMLKKIHRDGSTHHLVRALEALEEGNREVAAKEVAGYLIAEKALNGPLRWINHQGYIEADKIQVQGRKISGRVSYRDATYQIEMEI